MYCLSLMRENTCGKWGNTTPPWGVNCFLFYFYHVTSGIIDHVNYIQLAFPTSNCRDGDEGVPYPTMSLMSLILSLTLNDESYFVNIWITGIQYFRSGFIWHRCDCLRYSAYSLVPMNKSQQCHYHMIMHSHSCSTASLKRELSPRFCPHSRSKATPIIAWALLAMLLICPIQTRLVLHGDPSWSVIIRRSEFLVT